MNKLRLFGMLCAAAFSSATLPANAVVIDRLPASHGGTDRQGYYDFRWAWGVGS
jgi:hypothetical protein